MSKLTVEEELSSSADGVRNRQKCRPGLGGKRLGAGVAGARDEDDLRRGTRSANGIDSGLDTRGPLSQRGDVVRLVHDTELSTKCEYWQTQKTYFTHNNARLRREFGRKLRPQASKLKGTGIRLSAPAPRENARST